MKRTIIFSFFYVCLLLALLSSCQSDPTTGTTTVEGQVVDSQSGKGVPNATVQVYQAPAI